MSDARGRSRWLRVGAFALIVVLYLVRAVGQAIDQKERINADAACYIKRAEFLARGVWSHSVSGYCSAMLSWSVAAFVGAGWDGRYAARAVLLGSGIIYLAAVWWFFERLKLI